MTGTLARQVVAGLKEQILAGELAPGARLPSESSLITTFGVSRTVVREAVTRLQAEGLAETFQGRGSFVLAVPEPSPFTLEAGALRTSADVLDMIDFRLGVECEAASLAARRLSAASRVGVEEALAAFDDEAPQHAVEADFAFHRAVARASGNRFFVDLLDSLGPMMIMLPRTRLGEEHSPSEAAHAERLRREHEAIAAAVLAGDADGARAAMRVHLASTRRRLTPA